MNKKLIFKIVFLFIISTAFTYTAKADFNITLINNRNCNVLVEVLDINSNVLYSVTVAANTGTPGVTYTCVGGTATPTGMRYTATGCSPSPIIPMGANQHECSTCCSCFNTSNTGAFTNSMVSGGTGSCFVGYTINTEILL